MGATHSASRLNSDESIDAAQPAAVKRRAIDPRSLLAAPRFKPQGWSKPSNLLVWGAPGWRHAEVVPARLVRGRVHERGVQATRATGMVFCHGIRRQQTRGGDSVFTARSQADGPQDTTTRWGRPKVGGHPSSVLPDKTEPRHRHCGPRTLWTQRTSLRPHRLGKPSY